MYNDIDLNLEVDNNNENSVNVVKLRNFMAIKMFLLE